MKLGHVLSTLVLVAGVLAVGACSKSGGGGGGGEAAIEKRNMEWLDLVSKKDAAGIAETIYAEDGVMLPPGAPRINGREAIKGMWEELLTTQGAELNFKTDRLVMSSSGDMAADIGTYDLASGQGATAVKDHGKYTVVWVKKDGKWQVLSDMFSSDAGAPAGN